MTIDLAKIPYKHFGCVTTSIGELCIFSISWGSQKELRKELGKPLNECEPKEFIRKFIRYVCFPKNSLNEGENKPKNPLLSDKDILSLTENDLEKIAQLYIKNNDYLFKNEIVKEVEGPDKVTVVSYEYGEIEYPKEEDENYIQYFFRLYIKYLEKMGKGIADAISSIVPDIKSFSNQLGDSIKNTLSWGNALSKTMESIRQVNIANIMPVGPSSPISDILKIEHMKEERRLQPFNDLADRLDRLIDASAQATEFMIKANEIQTRIAGEIKSSSDGTTKYSKINILLTVVVILLTALSIVFPAYTNFQSNRNNQINRIEDRENVSLMVENLKKINASIINSERLRIENEGLKSLIEKQEKTITEMKILNDRQGNKNRQR